MSGLGRGLGSLIPPKINTNNVAANSAEADLVKKIDKDNVLQVPLDKLKPNTQQPRRDFDEPALHELASSIREHGILQPLVVRRDGDNYEIIAGERRWRAAQMINLKTVPVMLRQADDDEKLALALVENIQRKSLTPLERARGYQQLLQIHGMSHDELAKHLSIARPNITNYLRFLRLPKIIQDALENNKIEIEHAKIIAGMPTEAKQLALFNKIVAQKLSRRQTTLESQKMGGTKASRVSYHPVDEKHVVRLKEQLGLRSMIKRRQYGGQLIIQFFDDEELERIVTKLLPS